MTRYERTKGGLTIVQKNFAWSVLHDLSGLSAVTGLRQRRFAEQARDDLLATGVDFTRDTKAISADRARWADAYWLWQRRSQQEKLDPDTWEYYSDSTHYGSFIPSAAEAAQMRAGGSDAYSRIRAAREHRARNRTHTEQEN